MKEEQPENGKHDEKLDQNDHPEPATCKALILKPFVVKPENSPEHPGYHFFQKYKI